MKQTHRNLTTIRLDGGALCLDFVNTIHDRFEENSEDYVHSYADLLMWGQISGAIGHTEAERLHHFMTANERESETVFQESIVFREYLYQIIIHFIHSKPIPEQDNAVGHVMFSQMWDNLELRADGQRFVWQWRDDAFGLRSILWKIVYSAVNVLTSDDATRIKECGRCGWLFLDTSRNKSRRWCSMETCGNRTKAARHYQKNQGKG